MIRIVQPGLGLTRPVVWICHQAAGSVKAPTFIDDRIRAAVGESVCVLSYTAPIAPGKITTGGAYREVGAVSSKGFRLPSFDEVAASFAPKVGAQKFSHRIAAGFSEGCQGVRAQLVAGAELDAIVCADGIHGGYPTPVESFEVLPFRRFFDRARAGKAAACVSHTMIDTRQGDRPYMPVREMLQIIAQLELPSPKKLPPIATVAGDLLIYSYPGGDIPAHQRQLQITLPVMLHESLCRIGWLDFGGPEEKALNAAIAGGPVNLPPLPPSGSSGSSSSSSGASGAGSSTPFPSPIGVPSGPPLPPAPPSGGAGPTVPAGGVAAVGVGGEAEGPGVAGVAALAAVGAGLWWLAKGKGGES